MLMKDSRKPVIGEFDKFTDAPGEWQINIFFDKSQVGSLDIVDRGLRKTKFTRYAANASNITAGTGVIDDPVYGVGYNHNQNISFLAQNGRKIGFFDASSEMELAYVTRPSDPYGVRMMVCTGTYPANRDIKQGYAIGADQFTTNHMQFFMTSTSGTTFAYFPDLTSSKLVF